ncbi:hypothetical protein QVD17_01928 [Tagetes erecta]|uniref:Uncharacterized protein n=1 Tax=Tagetes erecta TaxID=13708 RepID=A0AAD8LD09_TARER|nr:hypothetical protein QVD17_01928 [Tagetes erecta]
MGNKLMDVAGGVGVLYGSVCPGRLLFPVRQRRRSGGWVKQKDCNDKENRDVICEVWSSLGISFLLIVVVADWQ